MATISTKTWDKWVPILLKCPCGEIANLKLQPLLVQAAYSRTPNEVITRLEQVIDSDNDHLGSLSVGRELDLCWDGRLGTALLAKAGEPHLKPRVVSELLQTLLEHNVAGSRDLAKSFIIVPPPASELQKALMLGAIEALTAGAHDAGWPEIWPVIRDYPEFGRLVVGSLSYAHAGFPVFIQKLSEEQLGKFYIWLLVNYPPATFDHVARGAIGPGEAAVMFRDHALEHLKKRATFAACEAIRGALEILPQHSWLGFHLEEAESLARAATWQPVSPRQFLTLAFDPGKRLVDSTQQLLDRVFDSLDKLQLKIHGELPASKDLWNADQGEYWPKDEKDFSDYVARHLDEDIQRQGVVINREVQIRRGTGGGTGQLTDIHVDAVIAGARLGTYARIYAIIEAKGSWSQELFENMEIQLRDRYLKENRCRSGIYLVGWFSCARWKDDDPRKKQRPLMSIEEARERFSQQALELSRDGFDIRSYVLDVSLS